MAYTAAAGYPTLESAGMFPTVWARELNRRYYKEALITKITTSRYLVALKNYGHEVVVREPGSIDIFEHEKGKDMPLQVPEPKKIVLTMKKSKGFNFGIDDLDLAQTDMKQFMSEHQDEAIKTYDEVLDAQFFADIVTKCDARNTGTAAGDGLYDIGSAADPVTIGYGTGEMRPDVFLLMLRGVLKQRSAFVKGKCHVVCPDWFEFMLMNSSLKKANEMGDDKSIVRTGFVGQIANMNVWPCLQLASIPGQAGSAIMPFCNMDAIAFLTQVQKIETYRPEKRMMNAVKGIWGYDWGVIRPEGLGAAYVKIGTMPTT